MMKIYGTLGPACSNSRILADMSGAIRLGFDTAFLGDVVA
jgi:hypothetical protein